MRKIWTSIAAVLLLVAGLTFASLRQTPAYADSCPTTFYYGQVLTVAQWQACFDQKRNPLTGGTLTGELITTPSTSVSSGLNIAVGTNPTSPVDGDLWTTGSGLFVQIGGVTYGPLNISNGLPTGDIFVGNISGVATPVVMSGDATIASDGALTLSNTGVTAGSYVFPTISIDNAGRITSASSSLQAGYFIVGNASNIATPVQMTGDCSLDISGAVTCTLPGTVTLTGTPATGNLAEFSGSSSITNGDLSGDCTTSGTLVVSCTGILHTWTASQRSTVQTLALSTATATPNFDTGNNFTLTLSSACPCTLANPSTTPVAGQSGVMEIIQDATGGRTITTWGSDYIAPGGTSTLALSSGANARDYFSYYVADSTHIVLSLGAANATH